MMTIEQMRIVWAEVECRWRSRTPAKSAIDVDPGYRVPRSEVRSIITNLGFHTGRVGLNEIEPLDNDDWDRMRFELFDRLREEFPNERWDNVETPATIRRRKELE